MDGACRAPWDLLTSLYFANVHCPVSTTPKTPTFGVFFGVVATLLDIGKVNKCKSQGPMVID